MKSIIRTLLVLCVISTAAYAQLPDVVINEINFNSSPDADAEDWLEIFNRTNSDIDISGWVLKDSNDDNEFIIPANTTLAAGDYLVLITDSSAFRGNHPNVVKFIGTVDFKFSNGGELLRLYDDSATLIDQVEYDDEGDWPTASDGEGPTLELIDPDKDNDDASNWAASTGNGTPGEANSRLITSAEDQIFTPQDFVLNQNYPNPFNPKTVIGYQLAVSSPVSLKVFDMLGREVAVLVNEFKSAGTHTIEFNAANIPSGIYIYQLSTRNVSLTRKMTLLK